MSPQFDNGLGMMIKWRSPASWAMHPADSSAVTSTSCHPMKPGLAASPHLRAAPYGGYAAGLAGMSMPEPRQSTSNGLVEHC